MTLAEHITEWTYRQRERLGLMRDDSEPATREQIEIASRYADQTTPKADEP